MKTLTRISTLFFLALTLANCSSSDDGGGESVPVLIPPSVTTNDVDNINGLNATMHGTISSVGSGVFQYGFCYGTNPNPTLQNSASTAINGSYTGAFSETISFGMSNATYYVRAYAGTFFGGTEHVTYGNQVAFTTGFPIDGLKVADIATNKATFGINVITVPQNVYRMGVVYGTLQNPTVTNGDTVDFQQEVGIQNYSNNYLSSSMTPNTTYYARTYYELTNDEVYYGEQTTFRTTGYYGPAGGYVAYDKGEFTDGWRYLEVDPNGLLYSGYNPDWGCQGTFVSNTYTEMGTGTANTLAIVLGCNAANCAARLCNNLVRGGQSDWFLGSRNEMLTIVRSLKGLNINIQSCWTSSETTAMQAYRVFLNSNPGDNVTSAVKDKSADDYVLPIRRY